MISGCHDPYDPWMNSFSVKVRERFYEGSLAGKVQAAAIAGLDWLAPQLLRTAINAPRRKYPISVAHQVMTCRHPDAGQAIRELMAVKVPGDRYGVAWGLGFPWMSKNGLYGPEIPFVTHTPYAMEALLMLSRDPSVSDEAIEYFRGTWQFLESLVVQHESTDQLALSYAPVSEPRIVVNANAYAAFAYALHATHHPEQREVALEKMSRLVNWVASQQDDRGAWFYYADTQPGNFIDCFHTCFVLKNLIKAGALHEGTRQAIASVIDKGLHFLETRFSDAKTGLMKRFETRDFMDPYKWDLYDQAEYLGLLVLLKRHDEAWAFFEKVEQHFSRNNSWACRIDFLGRRWGWNFRRWGIDPLLYHQAKLARSNS